MSAWFGFAGDFLTFLGGVVLALDAILEERKFRKIKDWEGTITAPELARVVITRGRVKLKTKDDVELSFVRQSTRRARRRYVDTGARICKPLPLPRSRSSREREDDET